MAKIKITNLQQEYQLISLNASEVKQVVGGFAILSRYPITARSTYLNAFYKNPVNSALLDASKQTREAGNTSRADELFAILAQRFNVFMSRRPIVDQIVAPG